MQSNQILQHYTSCERMLALTALAHFPWLSPTAIIYPLVTHPTYKAKNSTLYILLLWFETTHYIEQFCSRIKRVHYTFSLLLFKNLYRTMLAASFHHFSHPLPSSPCLFVHSTGRRHNVTQNRHRNTGGV